MVKPTDALHTKERANVARAVNLAIPRSSQGKPVITTPRSASAINQSAEMLSQATHKDWC